jgi:conserved oligomeric Golgi complex subunit 1
VCLSLQELLPHTLPTIVAQLLVDNLTKQFYNFYQMLSEDETVMANQNLALQYFFDLKWITLMLITRDSKAMLDKYTALIGSYKSFIDPFDFDVFYSHLNTNVKKSGQRMQFQIGCIIPSMEQLLAVLSGQQLQPVVGSGAHEKDPNVLPLSSNATTVTWFPLLPLSIQQGDTLSVQSSASDLQQLEKERVSCVIEMLSFPRFISFRCKTVYYSFFLLLSIQD